MTETSSLGIWALIKNSTYFIAFTWSVTSLGFEPGALGIYATLMITDVITGVTKSYVLLGGQSVTSKLAKDGVLKKILALVGLFSVGLAGQGVGFNMSNFVQGAVTVFILAECYSILGNIHSARTGNVKVEFDAVAWLLGKIGELLNKVTK